MMYLCANCGYVYGDFTVCPKCGEYDYDLVPDADEEIQEGYYVPISAQDAELEDFERTYFGGEL